jgi:ketosteroid isomerase-like protein
MPDRRTVDSLLDANERFYRTFERLDYPAMEALWEDSDRLFCCHPDWMPLRGRRPVLESWARIIANTSHMRFALSGAHGVVAGNVGVVTVYEGISTTVGAERHSSGVVSTNLFGWDEEAALWKLFHHHSSHTAVPDEPETGPLLV